MHDGVNEKELTRDPMPPEGVETKKLLRAMERRDQGLLILPILAIIVLSLGLILSDRSFWDSGFSLREGKADELGFLTLNLILYITFRHRQVRKIYNRLMEQTIRSETLSRRFDELKSLLEVSTSVRSTGAIDTTLDTITENARMSLEGELATLHLRRGDGSHLDCGAESIAEGVQASVGDVPIGHGVAGVVSYTGRPVILSDGEEVQARAIDVEGLAGMNSVLSVPLVRGTTQLGTLTIGKTHDTNAFTLADLQLLIIFADYAAHVIETSHLQAQIQRTEEELAHSRDALSRAQRHMAQTEKLPTIERMVSRLGHDLANPLTSILGYTQLLQKTEQVARNREYVDNIFGQTRRCQEIVEGFLSYVRGKGSGRFECDLEHIIEQSLELERAHFESGSIRVDRRLAGDLPPVAGNSFLLQEALLHIVHNAEQAMRDVPAPRRLEIATGRDEQMAWVEVADNGPGIHPAHVSRIFEPFFSTREDPGSDGLGLTVAARIIQEHGGTLQYVDGNEPGARFRIELPVPQEAPNAVAPSVSSEGPSPVADAPPAPEATNRLAALDPLGPLPPSANGPLA